MAKYRLNIKYPIEEENAVVFTELYNLDKCDLVIYSQRENSFGYFEIEIDTERKTCPKEWIEEVKESDFEKWNKENPLHPFKKHDYGYIKRQRLAAWKASEKNTHKIYKELMDVLNTINIETPLHYRISNFLEEVNLERKKHECD